MQSYERMNLADALIPKTFEHDTRIIKQGDVADGMYFVEEGTVRITIIADNGQEVNVAVRTAKSKSNFIKSKRKEKKKKKKEIIQ